MNNNTDTRTCDNPDTEHPGFPCNHPAPHIPNTGRTVLPADQVRTGDLIRLTAGQPFAYVTGTAHTGDRVTVRFMRENVTDYWELAPDLQVLIRN